MFPPHIRNSAPLFFYTLRSELWLHNRAWISREWNWNIFLYFYCMSSQRSFVVAIVKHFCKWCIFHSSQQCSRGKKRLIFFLLFTIDDFDSRAIRLTVSNHWNFDKRKPWKLSTVSFLISKSKRKESRHAWVCPAWWIHFSLQLAHFCASIFNETRFVLAENIRYFISQNNFRSKKTVASKMQLS